MSVVPVIVRGMWELWTLYGPLLVAVVAVMQACTNVIPWWISHWWRASLRITDKHKIALLNRAVRSYAFNLLDNGAPDFFRNEVLWSRLTDFWPVVIYSEQNHVTRQTELVLTTFHVPLFHATGTSRLARFMERILKSETAQWRPRVSRISITMFMSSFSWDLGTFSAMLPTGTPSADQRAFFRALEEDIRSQTRHPWPPKIAETDSLDLGNHSFLIDGPPGVGKSSTAQWLAQRWEHFQPLLLEGFNLFERTLGDLHHVLRLRKNMEPVIVVIDDVEYAMKHSKLSEGDLIVRKGSQQPTDVRGAAMDKATLSHFLDQIRSLPNLVLILTTNMPWLEMERLYPEYTRPGRITRQMTFSHTVAPVRKKITAS